MDGKDVKSIFRRLQEINPSHGCKYALSVQTGAGLIAPHAVYKEVHLYISDRQSIKFFRNVWELKETDRGANLVFMLPYYKHSAFYDSHVVEGLPVVSDIQLYLDFYGYPLRGREQAEHLYDKRLKTLFSGAENND